jgi:cutinase
MQSYHGDMLSNRLLSCLGAAVLASAASAAVLVGAPSAAAQPPCPDIEVIFARGTGAQPGIGFVGDSFVNALRGKVGGKSVDTYAVNYPAGFDFATSAPQGAADATNRVQFMADTCPNTKLVLGGMSQGAGVIDLMTADARPMGPNGKYTPRPLPPNLADHVAAVAVFGNPLRNMAGAGPLPAVSSAVGGKTIDMCAANDIFCTPGKDLAAHFSYADNGMTDEAANFVAGRVQ